MSERGSLLPAIAIVVLILSLSGAYFILKNNPEEQKFMESQNLYTVNTTASKVTLNKQKQSPAIKLTAPVGYEEWKLGKTQTILWNQQGLEDWGNSLHICLFAFDDNNNPINPVSTEKTELCTYKYGTMDGAYLISNVTVTNQKYEWNIPNDLLTKFKKRPSFFKIDVQIYDNLNSKERTEWAGLIANDESPNYIKITESTD